MCVGLGRDSETDPASRGPRAAGSEAAAQPHWPVLPPSQLRLARLTQWQPAARPGAVTVTGSASATDSEQFSSDNPTGIRRSATEACQWPPSLPRPARACRLRHPGRATAESPCQRLTVPPGRGVTGSIMIIVTSRSASASLASNWATRIKPETRDWIIRSVTITDDDRVMVIISGLPVVLAPGAGPGAADQRAAAIIQSQSQTDSESVRLRVRQKSLTETATTA